MSDTLKAVDDDIRLYVNLCRHYGEKVRTHRSGVLMGEPDPSCNHAWELEKRGRKDGIIVYGEYRPQGA